MQPDLPAAQDADSFAKKVGAAQLFGMDPTVLDRLIALAEFAGESQQESEGVLGHGVFTIVLHIGDFNVPLFAGIEVNMVDAG
jgi:hypothetical protein